MSATWQEGATAGWPAAEKNLWYQLLGATGSTWGSGWFADLNFSPLLNYMRRRFKVQADNRHFVGVREDDDPRNYARGLHGCLRMNYIADDRWADKTEWDRLVTAYIGPVADPIAPFITDTVRQLVRPSRFAPCLPIIADAFQDAGLPDTHWLLARLRDESTPFVKREWFDRQIRRPGMTRP